MGILHRKMKLQNICHDGKCKEPPSSSTAKENTENSQELSVIGKPKPLLERKPKPKGEHKKF